MNCFADAVQMVLQRSRECRANVAEIRRNLWAIQRKVDAGDRVFAHRTQGDCQTFESDESLIGSLIRKFLKTNTANYL